jgi:hypothetical protein
VYSSIEIGKQRSVKCRVCSQKRHSSADLSMSAKCQKRTVAPFRVDVRPIGNAKRVGLEHHRR